MKYQWGLGLGALLVAGAGGTAVRAASQPPLFQPATNLYAGAALLAPGSYAIPCVTDWNGDGRKDLLVGYQAAGKVALFLNTGSDAQPVFASFSNLQAGGADIQHPSGGCGAPAPWVCDFDADGRRDLLVGEGNYGYVYFYRNTNTDAAPRLAAGVQLLAGGVALQVPTRATPCLQDWDEDGRPDLLCGGGDGYVYYFHNTNTAQTPLFAPGIKIRAGGADLFLTSRAVPRVFDWDGDGRKDLVCSSATTVGWCRNTGSNAAPQLAALETLRVPQPAGGLAPITASVRMRLDLADWNNDGVTDLLLGNADGTVQFYEGYCFKCARAIRGAGCTVTLRWQSAPYLQYRLLSGATPDAITNVWPTNVLSGGRLTAWTNAPQGGSQFFRVAVAP